MKAESHLQIQVCTYLKMQYPNVIFFSEPSGLRVSIGQAVQLKKMRSFGKLPDLFLAKPMGDYAGLFIELKADGSSPYLKSGELSKDKHIQAQAETLSRLRAVGYAAYFATGFKEAKKITDMYLNYI